MKGETVSGEYLREDRPIGVRQKEWIVLRDILDNVEERVSEEEWDNKGRKLWGTRQEKKEEKWRGREREGTDLLGETE